MPDRPSVGVEGVREGGLARIVLDRPRALNALTLPMVRRILGLLEKWQPLPLRAVTIESSTPGMFCAGGDIRQVRQNTLDHRPSLSDEFFATEYRVNGLLASSPWPVVAIIDGLCMGGGVGLSVHGQFRVVTDRAVLAMPETAIGFFPDVGASHFLSRLPGGMGVYLGLTGARLSAAESVESGLGTHHVSSEDVAAVRAALAEDMRPVDAILRDFVVTPVPPTGIMAQRQSIDRVFTASSMEEINDRLERDSSDWAAKTRQTLSAMSPQSLALTLDLILWGKQRSLQDCLDAELKAAHHVSASPDFVEGVRAALVDKDRAPRWGESRYRGTSSSGVLQWATTTTSNAREAVRST